MVALIAAPSGSIRKDRRHRWIRSAVEDDLNAKYFVAVQMVV
jgi:hypothetical protein